MNHNYRRKIELLGYTVSPGLPDIAPTARWRAEDKADHWYIEHPDTPHEGHRGTAYKTLFDAYVAAYKATNHPGRPGDSAPTYPIHRCDIWLRDVTAARGES